MSLKNLLSINLPAVSKSTPYWRALKICSLLFLIPEVILAFAFLFEMVTLAELFLISVFLLVLWPIEPLILRMRNDRTYLILIYIVLVPAIVFLVTMEISDRYYVKCVLRSYLQGEDYHGKSNSLLWFASSNAIAYTQFLIEESEFLRQSALEAKGIKLLAECDRAKSVSCLRRRIKERMGTLERRVFDTGYNGKCLNVSYEAMHAKYERLLKSLSGCSP
ncbi:MAG: hypothetical protein K6G91_08395 [Kiritimatiellae bacterium]|nr:hypothetical protein [Kiritimatiellia bacterium]